MGCGSCACCLETLYSVQTRQDTDVLVNRGPGATDFLRPLTTRTSPVFRVMGHSTLRISVQTNANYRIRVEVNGEPDGSGPFREAARFDTIPDPNGLNFIETQFIPSGRFVRIIEEALAGELISAFRAIIEAQPLGSDPGSWAGLGSQIGPGEDISTLADIALAAGVPTTIFTAAQLPPGTRRITVQNVGASTIRVAELTAAGAARGLQLLPNQTASFGTRGGAIEAIEANSIGGASAVSRVLESD